MTSADAMLYVAILAVLTGSDCGQSTDMPSSPTTPLTAFAGDYTMTVSANEACAIPSAFRTRTYIASVLPVQGFWDVITLSGAEFYDGYGILSAQTSGNTVRINLNSWYAADRWLDNLPIFERPSPTSYVAVLGTTPYVDRTQPVIRTSFDGTYSYCTDAQAIPDKYPPACRRQPVECVSSQHQITLERR
jgi:hypothetical protein